MKSRISIIGSGNVALAAAYHFQLTGIDVCLYGSPGFDEAVGHVENARGIRALESIDGSNLEIPGFEAVARTTRDIAEAVGYSDVLLLPVPSFAQEPLFRSMLPHLRTGQTIVLMPGNYGALVLHRMLREAGGPEVGFVDASTVPWATRIVGNESIAIYGIKRVVPVAVYPGAMAAQSMARVSAIFPTPVLWLSSVIEAALENINFGGHPALTLLSIGLLENHNGAFNFYRDCTSPSVARVAQRIDEERLAVGRALGLSLRSELDMLNLLYGTGFETVAAFNRQSATHAKIDKSPSSADSRYITEDVPYLMTPCLELAQAAGVETPLIRSCIALAGAMNGTDYIRSGRNLSAMGLGSEPSNALLKLSQLLSPQGVLA